MKNITIGTLFFANTTFQDDELSAKNGYNLHFVH